LVDKLYRSADWFGFENCISKSNGMFSAKYAREAYYVNKVNECKMSYNWH
jgi:hypothetical protein